MFANGHPLDYLRASGGPVAYVIRKQLTDLAMHGNGVMIIERVTQRLTDHYQLRDYYRPVSLMREALACMVKLKELITRIHPDFHPVLDELSVRMCLRLRRMCWRCRSRRSRSWPRRSYLSQLPLGDITRRDRS